MANSRLMSADAGHALRKFPRISVVVPCRNESKFIGQCLDSILRNDYPRERVEILVVDGMSEDGTWSIVSQLSETHSNIRALRNAAKITPISLNLGIQNASGDIIFRIDAHAQVPTSYLRLCVEALESDGADNVGGAMQTLPQDESLLARAIALGIGNWFGAGDSAFRTAFAASPVANANDGGSRTFVTDTVFGGCYRREVFERVGYFNERLSRGQDMEFNCRLRRAGGKIVLDPRITSSYYAPGGLGAFWRHNFNDGAWAILPFAYSEVFPVRARHLVPLVFVSALFLTMFFSLRFSLACVLLLILAGSYFAASVIFAAAICRRERDSHLFFALPIVFANRHFAYGLGSVWGLLCVLFNLKALRHLVSLAKFKRTCDQTSP